MNEIKNNPAVTVAIPVYNGANYLSDCINSVLNQSFTNFELLIINDGSKDNSMEIASSFSDNRIKIINDGINKGLVKRLNQSVSLARGHFYARMDADDIMHPDRILKEFEFLKRHQHVDVVGTGFYSIDDKNNIRACSCYPTQIKQKHTIPLLHPTAMGKTSWFMTHRYDDKFVRMEDIELWRRASSVSTYANIEEPLIFYREYGVPTIKKYIQSQLTTIRFYCSLKKYNNSIYKSINGIVFAIIKIIACLVFKIIGRVDLLIKLRKRPQTEYDYNKAYSKLKEAIKHID